MVFCRSFRLRYSLIDRLVETGQILDVGTGQALVVGHPLLDDACPKRPVFRNHLIDVKTIGKAKGGMNLCGAFRKRAILWALAARFIEPLSRCLCAFEVVCNKLERSTI